MDTLSSLRRERDAARAEIGRLKGIIGAWWADPDNPPVEAVPVAREVRPELFQP